MKSRLAQIFLFLFIGLYASLAFAQQPEQPCTPSLAYENHNQVDYGPLSLRRVAGRVIVELGDHALKGGYVSKACLGVFTEQDHRLIAETVADEDGRFSFKSIPAGRYRLVVRANPLCIANVPLHIVSWPRGGLFTNKKLVIHMRPAGIDQCSYGDYK